MNKLRIGLDIDDTILFWYSEYLKRFGEPKNQYEITRHVQRDLITDRNFWLNLPPKHYPDFSVTLYCTKRVCNKDWSKRWIKDHEYPIAPVYQLVTQSKNKADVIKGRVDVFVDDSVSNFIAMNLAGVPCLLMDCDYNQDWGPIGRIYSLNRDEIEEVYNLFMSTLFNDFDKLI
jgi:uncharacterized HAD superfamily protein